MLLFLLLLQTSIADFIISYDLDETIQISYYTNCSSDFKINYDTSTATYSSNLMTINVEHMTNGGLKALIKLNNSPDNYTFIFLTDRRSDIYIYNMFKYLTIYKNEIKIGHTYVFNDNISILTPNIDYIINQDTYAPCPLTHLEAYYCLVLNDTVIPQNVVIAGIAVTLTANHPIHHYELIIAIPIIILFVLIAILWFCICYIKNRLNANAHQAALLNNEASTVASEPESNNTVAENDIENDPENDIEMTDSKNAIN
jgi:predicted small integral membrane protein